MIDGTKKFPFIGYGSKKDMMQVYPPIDLTNRRVRTLAKELGSA